MVLPLFFFNDPPTTEISTLSLRDALPFYGTHLGLGMTRGSSRFLGGPRQAATPGRPPWPLRAGSAAADAHAFADARGQLPHPQDRKSTRLNSSHANISYAVFCLKKKT